MHLPDKYPSRRQALLSAGALLSSAWLAPRLAAGSRPRIPRTGRAASAFLEAVVAGDLARVRSLLAADPGLARSVDERGRSAFVLAHLHDQPEVAGLLHATGLELDVVEAVLAEDWKRVEELAAAEPARMQRAHPIGGTPLYAAALVGSHDAYRLRSLGCPPDLAPEGGTGFTPARGALECVRPGWAHISLCDMLGNGGDANAPQAGGSSILHGAVLRRDEALVRTAVRKGAAVDARDEAGRTARELALEIGWTAGAELLAEHRALPRDDRGSRFELDANREPVRRADLADVPQDVQSRVTGSSHGKLDAVREHVERDPRLVFSISTDDELAIEACAHTGARPIIRYHLDHGAPLSLPTAVSLGDVETAAFWLERDPGLIHERGAHDFPLLWYALLGEEKAGEALAMAELLLEFGAEPDQETAGTTTLHLCARHDVRDLAAYLLERGADPTAVGFKWHRDGRTPLQMAEEKGHAAMADMLRVASRER
jgi:ankyrin repeat protein